MLLIPEKNIVARNIQEQVAENVNDISELQDGASELQDDISELKDGIEELREDVDAEIANLEQYVDNVKGTKLYKHTLSRIVPDTANGYYNYPAGFISTDRTPLTRSTFGRIIRPEVLKIWGYNINDSQQTDIVEFPVCNHAAVMQEEDPSTGFTHWAAYIWQIYYGSYGYAKIFIENMTDTVTEL